MSPEQMEKYARLRRWERKIEEIIKIEILRELHELAANIREVETKKKLELEELERFLSYHKYEFGVADRPRIDSVRQIEGQPDQPLGSPLSPESIAAERALVIAHWDKQILAMLQTRKSAERRINCDLLDQFTDLMRNKDVATGLTPQEEALIEKFTALLDENR